MRTKSKSCKKLEAKGIKDRSFIYKWKTMGRPHKARSSFQLNVKSVWWQHTRRPHGSRWYIAFKERIEIARTSVSMDESRWMYLTRWRSAPERRHNFEGDRSSGFTLHKIQTHEILKSIPSLASRTLSFPLQRWAQHPIRLPSAHSLIHYFSFLSLFWERRTHFAPNKLSLLIRSSFYCWNYNKAEVKFDLLTCKIS